MAESLHEVDGRLIWPWWAIMDDLQRAGLEGLNIDPFSVTPHDCGGEWREVRFGFSWRIGQQVVLMMDRYEPAIVDALAAVVEYHPFCRCLRKGAVSIIWAKKAPEAAYVLVQLDKDNSEVIRLDGANLTGLDWYVGHFGLIDQDAEDFRRLAPLFLGAGGNPPSVEGVSRKALDALVDFMSELNAGAPPAEVG